MPRVDKRRKSDVKFVEIHDSLISTGRCGIFHINIMKYHFIEYYTLISISIYSYIHTHIYYQKQDISINHQTIGIFHNFPAYSRHVRVSKTRSWVDSVGLVGSREEIFRFSRADVEKLMVFIGKWSTHGGFSWIFHIELLVYSRALGYPRDVDDLIISMFQ